MTNQELQELSKKVAEKFGIDCVATKIVDEERNGIMIFVREVIGNIYETPELLGPQASAIQMDEIKLPPINLPSIGKAK
jgi:hypothetical protein